jgi:hypothetical protein
VIDRRAGRRSRNYLSALGAGVLLALATQCAGKSSSSSDDSGAAGDESGGASGNGGASGKGGTSGSDGAQGGTGASPSGGVSGVSSGGTAGTGKGGTGGDPTGGSGGCIVTGQVQYCFTPAEFVNCETWDAGVEDTVDGGNAGDRIPGDAGGMIPPPPPDAGSSDAGADDAGIPPTYRCPNGPFPSCLSVHAPPGTYLPLGWDGSKCCYTVYISSC